MTIKMTAIELFRRELILNMKHHVDKKDRVSFRIGLSKFDEIADNSEDLFRQQLCDFAFQFTEQSLSVEDFYDKIYKK